MVCTVKLTRLDPSEFEAFPRCEASLSEWTMRYGPGVGRKSKMKGRCTSRAIYNLSEHQRHELLCGHHAGQSLVLAHLTTPTK